MPKKGSVQMKKAPVKKQISILKKIAVPLIITALLQPLIFLVVIRGFDIVGKSDRQMCSAFSGRVRNAEENLNAVMTQTWSDLLFSENELNMVYASYCSENRLTDSAFSRSAAAQTKFLESSAGKLLETLRRNQTTGIFLVLNSTGTESRTRSSRNGVCIRDLNGYHGLENLCLERGPTSVAKQLNLSLDRNWRAAYNFTDKSCGLFVTMPLLAASEHPAAAGDDLGYWCPQYLLNTNDKSALSYSVPLISGSGNAYGVLGVEISQDYLKKFLSPGELGSGTAYSMAIVGRAGGKTAYSLTIPYGSSEMEKVLGGYSSFTAGKKLSDGCCQVHENTFAQKVVFKAQTLQKKNPLVSGSKTIALVGITSAHTLFSFGRQVWDLLIIALLMALVAGILGILTVSRVISSPIIKMSEAIRRMDDHETTQIQGIGISEIDSLIDSINHLNQNVARNEERLATILKLTNYPIGVFSIAMESGRVYSSSGLFHILYGLIRPGEEQELSDLDAFVRMLDKLQKCPMEPEEDGSSVYDIYPYAHTHRWIRVRETEQEGSLLGVVTDVTAEVQRKKQIEYERDHDPLTRLINRHAFQTEIEKLSRSPEELGVAAMMMFDVDGLKAVNDKYGHDCGDRYICGIADILRSMEGPNTVVSHISGDEFIALLYRRESKEEIREIVRKIRKKAEKTMFEFPDGTTRNLCVSSGLAWYPEDSTDLSLLPRYADFSMYQAKKSHCGTLCEFDSERYYQDNLSERRKELERILAGKSLQCALHPAVFSKDGRLAVYTAPIAPKSGVLITDEDLISIAYLQEKLYQVEQMNWRTALFAFKHLMPTLPENCRLLIRTIPGQRLIQSDYQDLLDNSGVPFRRIVPMVNVSECGDDGRGAKKIQQLRKLKLDMALCLDSADFTAFQIAVQIPFRYLLFSSGMTRCLVQNKEAAGELSRILDEAKKRKLDVICSGVSTWDEFRILRRAGIQIVQGPLLEKGSVHFPYIIK